MFKVIKKSKKSNARIGVLKTKHGNVRTPSFFPDATRASVRALTIGDLDRLGLESMIVNAYHLFLQPGIERIKKAGTVREFMGWGGPVMSDSGGYQIFSLIYKNKKAGRIRERGVVFRSPYNGDEHELTPEKSIQIQFDLGADLMVCLDDVPPHDIGRSGMEKSIRHTVDWARICKKEFMAQIKKRRMLKNRPVLFAVVQGGADKFLRKKCASALLEIGFDGLGYGARPVDMEGKFMKDILEYTARLIPDDKLRFGLGMGMPDDIVRSVKMGWDLFDCVIPTREARHARMYFWKGKGFGYNAVSVLNAKFASDFNPINPESKLAELRGYTKAYLHHLFKTGEPLSIRLATLNNMEFYLEMMRRIRAAIRDNKL